MIEQLKHMPGMGLLIFVCLALLANTAAIWKYQQESEQIAEPLAELVAQQLADSAASFVLNDDRVSLQAQTSKATRQDIVQHAAIYDVENRLLAQSGISRLADQGMQLRSEITLQNRLIGYARLSIEKQQAGAFNTASFLLLGVLCSLLGLYKLYRLLWPAKEESEEAAAAVPPSMARQVKKESSYQHLVEPKGDYAIIAVELLQLSLVRKQLSESALYEYLASFEHWLYQVAAEYKAQIRVGETGFTLVLSAQNKADSLVELEAGENLGSVASDSVYCAYVLRDTLVKANQVRIESGLPVFEARQGIHISSSMNDEAKLLRQLYAQDAHRQAWKACVGKAANTISLSEAVVESPHCALCSVAERDEHGFYSVMQIDPDMDKNLQAKVTRISQIKADIYDSMEAVTLF